jgi:tRNA pseudouridine38-40 synthase
LRYFFEISYKGTAYHGWQRQRNALSIQEVVENALSTIFQSDIAVTGSGRTDTGVHCEQQFFHVDLEQPIEEVALMRRLNAFLPGDISIGSIRKVRDDAHARFDAVKRKYTYRISRRKNPFLKDLCYHFYLPLDVDKMNLAASRLLLHDDFQSFSKVKTDTFTYLCDISLAEWTEENEMLVFYVSANRFLRGMVRALVGTLLDVGQGNISLETFDSIIASKDRKQAGRAAPPQGLFLTEVTYPKDIFI